MLKVHSIFGHGYHREDRSRLKQAGFNFRSRGTDFAGAQFLRHIDFLTCPCLELIEVRDHRVYENFVPRGMVPYSPGINLALDEDGETTIEKLREEFSSWGPYILHENYEGGEHERKPGWNYLNFREPLLPGTYLWVTEYEKPYPATPPKTTHPNAVTGVSGLLFDLSPVQFKDLSRLIGQPVQEGALSLGGTSFYSREGVLLEGGLPDTEFPLAAVLLQTENLDFFQSDRIPGEKTTFQGKPAYWIQNPPQCWDLIIHE